jgi:hypothetical protein
MGIYMEFVVEQQLKISSSFTRAGNMMAAGSTEGLDF